MTSGPYGAADLHAYLDGEMPAEEHAAFDEWLVANPDMRRLLSEFEADRQQLREVLDTATAGPVPERFLVPGPAVGEPRSARNRNVGLPADLVAASTRK